MKKAAILLKLDEEKLQAIRQYMGKKDTLLEDELQETLLKIYEKYVPTAVREYIDSRPEPEKRPRSRKNGTPLAELPTEDSEDQ